MQYFWNFEIRILAKILKFKKNSGLLDHPLSCPSKSVKFYIAEERECVWAGVDVVDPLTRVVAYVGNCDNRRFRLAW